MALPISVDKVLIPGDPVDAQLVNAIQEQTVYARAGWHRRTWNFGNVELFSAWSLDASNFWYTESDSGSELTFALDGFATRQASIRNVTLSVQDFGATETIDSLMYFVPQSLSSATGGLLDTVISDGSGTVQTLKHVGPFSEQTEDGVFYVTLVTSGGGTGLRKVRCIVAAEISLD